MPTWDQLEILAARYVGDSYKRIHTAAVGRSYLEAAELLTCLSRGLAEDTGNLLLTAGTPLYTIHGTLPDFVIPLRVTINGVLLDKTNLNAVSQHDPNWWNSHEPATAPNTPHSWFLIGAGLIGFYPTPKTVATAIFTYMQAPPTGQAGSASPVVPTEYHYLMPHYAAAMLFAIEGDVIRAAEEMQMFLSGLGDARSARFLPNAKQRNARATDVIVKQSED